MLYAVMRLVKILLDCGGIGETYRDKLRQALSDKCGIRVESKADATHPLVGAGSICAETVGLARLYNGAPKYVDDDLQTHQRAPIGPICVYKAGAWSSTLGTRRPTSDRANVAGGNNQQPQHPTADDTCCADLPWRRSLVGCRGSIGGIEIARDGRREFPSIINAIVGLSTCSSPRVVGCQDIIRKPTLAMEDAGAASVGGSPGHNRAASFHLVPPHRLKAIKKCSVQSRSNNLCTADSPRVVSSDGLGSKPTPISPTVRQIFVKPLASEKISLGIDSHASIWEVKTKLAEIIQVEPRHQRLIFRGRPLRDDLTVSSLELPFDHLIHLVYSLVGGSNTQTPGVNLSRLGVKIPPFWPKDPALWFGQVESQFTLANITTEETRFHHVVSALTLEAAAEVRDMILTPPTNPYTTLKDTLIARTSESAAQRVKKALDSAEVSDLRPTQILRSLERQLEGMKADPVLLKQVFLQKLPSAAKSIVAANSDKMTATELAELADRVYEHLPEYSGCNSVAHGEHENIATSSNFSVRLSRLEAMMSQMLSHTNNNGGNNHRRRQFSRSRSRSRFNPQGQYCFYHWKFGDKATKCTSPCQWNAKPSSSSGNERRQ